MEGQSSDAPAPLWLLQTLEIALLVSLVVALLAVLYAVRRPPRRGGAIIAIGLILGAYGVLWAWWGRVQVHNAEGVEVTCTQTTLSAAFPEISTDDGTACRNAARATALTAAGAWSIGLLATGLWIRRRSLTERPSTLPESS